MTDISFKDLEGDFDAELVSPVSSNRTKFPCQKCAGTGQYRYGYRYIRTGKCHACNGRGYFLTSPRDRAKARAASKASKAKKLSAAMGETMSQHEDLIKWLSDNVSWNSFAASLVDQFGKRGTLSDNQLNAAYRMKAKTEATLAAKAEKRESKAVTVDLTKIKEVFNNVMEAGAKRPKLRLGDLVISVAPATGRNAGHLYVKDHGEYAGKISPEGRFYASRGASNNIEDSLKEFAEDPMKAAVKHGRATGTCACCGRELTRKDSIELGVGPICANKWGF